MQIKHTFLFTLVLGLVWTGYLFAYILGPDPASNGVFGNALACATAGCHTGASPNSSGGSVTLSGLPSTWTPGQTYSLSVTIARTGQRVFGFQLSAVTDSTSQQAGTLAAGNSRVQVVCGDSRGRQVNCSTTGAVQFAEHVNAQLVTSTYSVNWTAPSSASIGTVRFNVAGNAANGDNSNQGDFIYTSVARVEPGAATPDTSTRSFTITDRSGSSVATDGSGDLTVGYSRIQPASGSTTPTGVAIFGFRQGKVLVTEAGVPASPLITSGRIYAEVNGPVNTGLAIANPNGQTANVTFYFTNTAGVDSVVSTTPIPGNGQIAKFLNEAPFSGGASLQGSFSFTSDVPVSVIALRGLTNERGEFLITTLPVTDLSAAASADAASLSHFADGGGWTTQIVLVNPGDSTVTGSIQFFSQGTATTAAVPVTVIASSQGGSPDSGSSFTYTIPRRSSYKLATSGTASDTASGSVRVTPSTGVTPSALAVFSFRPPGVAVTVSEAGVPGIRGNAFRLYVEATSAGSSVDTIQTGLAISNLAPTSTTATLELINLDGTATGLPPVPLPLPGNGQVAKFAHELFSMGSLFPFKGLLRISGGAPAGLSVVGLRGRYNERGEFLITTTPPSDEAATASSAELLFPHLVNGGGYTTQFILFSGTAGQSSSGNLRFVRQDGTAFNLTVN
ncbi:MAG: hypothetical protein HY646_10015 [Acidobacteria bacterium]|nr:hypothetical protein [Acidobacteriota bacterium]